MAAATLPFDATAVEVQPDVDLVTRVTANRTAGRCTPQKQLHCLTMAKPDVEQKVDMSLDELVAMRQKEAKKKAPKKKAAPRGGAKTKGKKPSKQAVAQEADKMKRQQKMNSRRGIGGPKLSQTEIQRRAAKKTKKKGAKVTLKGRGARVKKPAFRPAGRDPARRAPTGKAEQPKNISIEGGKTARPVSIKNFTLPKDTKMVISFKKIGKGAKAPAKKKAVAKRKAPARKAPARKAPARKAAGKKKQTVQVNVNAKKRPQRKKK